MKMRLGVLVLACSLSMVAEPLLAQPVQAPAATLQEIQRLLGASDLVAARAAVDAALATYPSDPVVHNLAGVVAAQQGSPGPAEAHFRRAIALAPGHPAAYQNLGRLYQARSGTDPGARAKAIEVYDQLAAIDPQNAEALYQGGYLLALEGRFKEAAERLARLPANLRSRPQVLAATAVALAGSGNPSGSAAAADALSADPQFAAIDVEALLPALERLENRHLERTLIERLDGRGLATPRLLHHLGRSYFRDARYEDARRILERAVVAQPTVAVLSDLGRAASRLGDHKGALGYLARARDMAPNDPEVHFLFGIVCVQLNLGAEAFESLKKAHALAPDNPMVNFALGSVALHRHDPSEAVPFFERYVQLQPEDPRGRFALGVARFSSGQFEAAKADLQQVAARPETAAGANYFLARIARQANDAAEARARIDEALRLNPSHADAWAELGLLQTRARQFAEAEQSLQKALALDRDNYLATVNLTALYTRTRDPRREAQEARLAALQQQREQQGQEFLRIIQVVPE